MRSKIVLLCCLSTLHQSTYARRNKPAVALESCEGDFEGDIKVTCDVLESHYGRETASKAKKSKECIAADDHDDRALHSHSSSDSSSGRNGRHLALKLGDLWDARTPDGRAEIPYEIRPGDYLGWVVRFIKDQLKKIEDASGVVTFVERTDEKAYLSIRNGPGCSSFVGKMSQAYQPQQIMLNYPGCMRSGTILHEVMHSLGFWHEHSRPDRDDYITIIEDNIIPGREHNFNKRSRASSLGSEYDFNSILHYPAYAFTKNGKNTIQCDHIIGQRVKLSDSDVHQLQLMYQCTSGPRKADNMEQEPCSKDCKCWEGATGCGDVGDEACQGDLVCISNICQVAPPPTKSPSVSPSYLRTAAPTTMSPTITPTKKPTKSPTQSPTKTITLSPTKSPTLSPTNSPTLSPTKNPTQSPTLSPLSSSPTMGKTTAPTAKVTSSPTAEPTSSPPTIQSTEEPTSPSPTIHNSEYLMMTVSKPTTTSMPLNPTEDAKTTTEETLEEEESPVILSSTSSPTAMPTTSSPTTFPI